MHRRMIAVLAGLMVILLLGACESPPTPAQQERATGDSSYRGLSQNQPAKQMSYSPTRESVNKWIETWQEPGKLAYVYLTVDGNAYGYYILQGLPVSYCAQLLPTYSLLDVHSGNGGPDFQVPAPSTDGVYYSGGQCNQYYGFDATTGAYLEFSIGGTQNYLLSTAPLPFPDARPLGQATVQAVRDGG